MKNTKSYFKRVIATLLIAITVVMPFCSQTAEAATVWRSTSAYKKYYSWVGIPVFTIGVKGDYRVKNNKKITKRANARCASSTLYPGWSIKKEKAKWVIKQPNYSVLRNNSTFFYGLNTQWIEVGIQSYAIELNKTVYP